MCSIDNKIEYWNIDKKTLNSLYNHLYDKLEYGGRFTFPYMIDTGEFIKRTSPKVISNFGESSSVTVPNAIVNFHTHPISCYLSEGTVWGWASGEDIRECIIFGLKGNVSHIIISVEGVYLIQLTPRILNKLVVLDDLRDKSLINKLNKKELEEIFKEYTKELNDSNSNSEYIKCKNKSFIKQLSTEYKNYVNNNVIGDNLYIFISDLIRGCIIVYIEIYFRSFHNFRTIESNGNGNSKYYPKDFLNSMNNFSLSNMFRKNTKCSNNLGCGGVSVGNKLTKTKKYIKDYENNTEIYVIDSHGNVIVLENIYLPQFYSIIPIINMLSDNFFKNCKWFNTSLTPNEVKINGKYVKYISSTIDNKKRLHFLKNNYNSIVLRNDVKFKYMNINGRCFTQDIKKFIRSFHKINYIFVIGSDKCIYCRKTEEYLKKNNIDYKKKFYKTIEEAVNILSSENISSIPAVFVNNKYIGGYTDLIQLIAAK